MIETGWRAWLRRFRKTYRALRLSAHSIGASIRIAGHNSKRTP